MPTREQLSAALKNADKAGDVEAARKIAEALRAQSSNIPTMGTFEGAGGQGPVVVQQTFDSGKTAAPFGAAIKAAFVDDPQAKIKIFADARFPNDPEGINRYRVVDGQIAYQGSDGNLYLEEGGYINPVGAGVARSALPTIMGTAGLAAGPAGAGIGAAGGEAFNKLIGAGLGDRQTSMGNAMDIATEGVLGYGGAKAGQLVGNAAERTTARDIGRYNPAEAQALQEAADRFGIPLEAAQLTNLPSVKARSHYLRMMAGKSADTFQRFDTTQDKAVTEAVTRFLDDVSPMDDAFEATARVQGAGKQAIDAATKVAAELPTPIYDAAKATADPLDVKPLVDRIDTILAKVKDKKLHSQLMEIRDALHSGDKLDDTLEGADEVKKLMDRMLDTSPVNDNALGNRGIGIVKSLRRQLIEIADQASPDYEVARAMAAPMLEYRKSLEDSVIGAISRLKNPKAQTAANMLFTNQSPTVVGRARHIVSKEDPDAWNAIVRTFLWGKFTKASQTNVEGEVINRGAKFAKDVFGSPEKQKVLRAAMEPEQYTAFSDLMKVLEASGRVQRAGSRTEFNRLVSGDLKNEATPITATVRKGLSPSRVLDMFQETQMEDYAARLADVMVDPNSLNRLKELRGLDPRSKKALEIAGTVLFVAPNQD